MTVGSQSRPLYSDKINKLQSKTDHTKGLGLLRIVQYLLPSLQLYTFCRIRDIFP